MLHSTQYNYFPHFHSMPISTDCLIMTPHWLKIHSVISKLFFTCVISTVYWAQHMVIILLHIPILFYTKVSRISGFIAQSGKKYIFYKYATVVTKGFPLNRRPFYSIAFFLPVFFFDIYKKRVQYWSPSESKSGNIQMKLMKWQRTWYIESR